MTTLGIGEVCIAHTNIDTTGISVSTLDTLQDRYGTHGMIIIHMIHIMIIIGMIIATGTIITRLITTIMARFTDHIHITRELLST